MVTRKPHIVGKPFPRVEAELKVSGRSRYIDDIRFGPDLLHACLVPSTEAHAALLRVDVSAAREMPGVVKVLTGQDFTAWLGLFLKDRPLLADDRVRYVGQPVAVVVAESREIAKRAASSVMVEYKSMPASLDVMAGIEADAALVHPELASYEGLEHVTPITGTNVGDHVQLQWGDMEAGWADADVVIEHTYKVGRLYHASLEPHGAVAKMEDGRMTLWASIQRPYTHRTMIAQALGLEPGQLRVIAPCVGGGFGGKAFPCIEAIVAAVARELPGRPIKLVLDRRQEFACAFMRPGLTARLKAGVRRDGVITALKAAYYWNVGASVDAAIRVVRGAVLAGAGPYKTPNCEVESYAVYTHEPPAGPMRGNGMAELHWAVEQHIDRLADAIGMDRLAFRLQNLVKGGDRLYGGRVMHATGLETCVRGAAEAIAWSEQSKSLAGDGRKVYGKGLAAMWNPVVAMQPLGVTALVTLDNERICTVSVGGVESGQGIYTLAVQLVASELGVPHSNVHFERVDTERGSLDWTATSGHLTWTMGNAVVRAAQDVKRQVLSFVAQAWDEPIGNLDIIEGVIVSYSPTSERTLNLTDLLSEGIATADSERVRPSFEGKGFFQATGRPALDSGDEEPRIPPIIHFSTGAQAVEVEIDVETGVTRVLQMAPAFDVGHALNPDIVRAQIKGGSVQGLGMALLEQIRFDHGFPLNRTFKDYNIATIQDIPKRIDPIIVEVPQDDGPYGARGIGEHVLIPTAPAIASAISNALGIYLDELPLTAEKIWQALETQDT